MTNDEGMTNDECGRPGAIAESRGAIIRGFGRLMRLPISGFWFWASFVIRHSSFVIQSPCKLRVW